MATATRSRANARASDDDEPVTLCDNIMGNVAALCFYALIFGIMAACDGGDTYPAFHLDSVSVSVHDNHNNNITAVWDIGFSFHEYVGDLAVWVRFMARDFKAGSVGSSGKWHVSVSTLLPRGFDFSGGGLTLEQVVFNCNNCGDDSPRYILKAVCKEVSVVGFWSNETVADLKGDPRPCPLVFHERIIQ